MRIGGKSKWPTLNYMAKGLVVYDGHVMQFLLLGWMGWITIPLRLLHLQW